MKKLFFCYEKQSTGSWGPVIYHGEKPGKSINGSDPLRSEFIEVEEKFLDHTGEPMFAKLMAAYPLPNY